MQAIIGVLYIKAVALVLIICIFVLFNSREKGVMGMLLARLSLGLVIPVFSCFFLGYTLTAYKLDQLYRHIFPVLDIVYNGLKTATFVSVSFTVVRALFERFFKQRLYQVYTTKIRKGVFSNDQRKICIPRHQIELNNFINKQTLTQNRFFFGVDQDQKPIYIARESLATHIQLLGPSGVGKTETIKPLICQAISMGLPVVVIDGKGDLEFANQLHHYTSTYTDRKFVQFNSNQLYTEHNQPIPIQTTSSSFNPLLSSTDPALLTELVCQSLSLTENQSDGDYYLGIQKTFLVKLFRLFLATKQSFSFEDIVAFIDHSDSRKQAYKLAKQNGNDQPVNEIIHLLSTIKMGDLMGLRSVIDQLFVEDKELSLLVNHGSEINIQNCLANNDVLVFSLAAGSKTKSNSAIAKMVITILNQLVGKKQGQKKKPFWFVVLEEFGQYPAESLVPLITTARNTNTALLLSYQTEAMLKQELADIIRVNTETKLLFRNPDDADNISSYFGTIQSFKRTDVAEDGLFATEQLQGKSSHREVDQFLVHPNIIRSLSVGQSVMKYREQPTPLNISDCIVSHPYQKMAGRDYTTQAQPITNQLSLRAFQFLDKPIIKKRNIEILPSKSVHSSTTKKIQGKAVCI